MKQIAANFKGYYKEIILGPLFKLLDAVFELMVPLVVANIIDVGIKNRDVTYIVQHGLWLVLLAVVGAAAAVTCQYYAAVAAGHFGRGLRNQLYRHVMSLSPEEISQFGAAGLITRLTSDTNLMQNGVNMAVRLGSRVPFLAVGSIVMAMLINWRIGLIFLLGTLLIILVLYIIMRHTAPRYGEIKKQQDTLTNLAGENLAGVRVIRAFSRQNQEQRAFAEESGQLRRLIIRVGRISAALNPLTSVIINLAIAGIVWLGSEFIFAGTSRPGEIIALVNYMNQTLMALLVAANLFVIFTRAYAGARRVAAVLDTQPAIVDGPGASDVDGALAIEFNRVSFGYHAGADCALEDISFCVRAGQTVGLIGGTGSGKSTLAALLTRQYDVNSGAVHIAGNDVRMYTLRQLRERFGVVPQRAVLFSGSVRHNMAIAAPSATEEEMWLALEAAQAAEFVREMPRGLDSELEEGGKNLSGGQRQRLTIARALLRRPQILVLDDSASALDYATDAALRRSIHKMAQQNREAGHTTTTLIISQRAAAIRHADIILVLDDGRLVGSGTHDELIYSNKLYREICQTQGILPAGEVMP